MGMTDISEEYFTWMCNHVWDGGYSKKVSYRDLLRYLNDVEFTYILPMDGNRFDDGIGLRYHFGYECGIDSVVIANVIDIRPCSVLEMMIALAIRCEESIMVDPDIGNRTGQWFWGMIVSLGLGSMTDDRFDKDYVDEVMDIFLNREYKPNGEGGLFTVHDHKKDMRDVEIWYQMCYYLSEIIE